MDLIAAASRDPMHFSLVVIVGIGLVALLVWLMRRGKF